MWKWRLDDPGVPSSARSVVSARSVHSVDGPRDRRHRHGDCIADVASFTAGVKHISESSMAELGLSRGQPTATRYVAAEVSYLQDRIVNVCFVGEAGARDREWTLIDAGLPGAADKIKRAAAGLFGDARPNAIVLTHGHFDHIGSVRALAREWDVPVFAHELELPYLTGRSAYPPPDPLVGGGLNSVLSVLFPRGPINLGPRVQVLPADGTVPGMRGWRWVPTPGHSPGHVSFVRDSDRTLIAGDAFVTTKQESFIAALTQRPEIHGPPKYFTPDWDTARESVRYLADYAPAAAITGHGPPMRGDRLQSDLRRLATHFDEWARPAHGRYRDRPAIADASGVVDVPPPPVSARTLAITGLAVGTAVGLAYAINRRRHAGDVRADDAALELGEQLAIADGGYDAAASPSTIDLR
jgi:glyoxylase-like metal-dependent hydrolase (beta-lactamase superfamily II)